MIDVHDKIQSFRSACERCRSQKLRCSQNQHPINGVACQRCLRAKVQCVFSPRARTGRPSEHIPSELAKNARTNYRTRRLKGKTSRDSVAEWCFSEDDSHEMGENDLPSFMSGYDHSIEPTESTELPESQGEQPGNLNSIPASLRTDAANLDTSALNHNTIADFINETDMGLFSFPNVTAVDSTSALLDETLLELGSITWDSSQGIYFPAKTPSMVSSDTLPTGGSRVTQPMALSPSYVNGYTDSYCTEKLSALAVKFHRQSKKTNQEPWVQHDAEQDRQSCLNDYPIDDILHLSQELINVLRCVSLNAGFRADTEQSVRGAQTIRKSPGVDENSFQKSPSRLNMVRSGPPSSMARPMSPVSDIRLNDGLASDRPSSHIDVDTPTALLILNCYTSLIHTYTVVFAHLYQHLRSVPFLHSPELEPPLRPGPQFGELWPSTEAYTRTYVVYRNLIETLGCIEDILDLPKDFRCMGVRADCDVRLKFDRAGRKLMSSDDEEESSRSSDSSSGAGNVARTGYCTGLLRVELVEAALRNESQIEEGKGGKGGALALLRKNMGRVKQGLRQRMAL